MNEIPEKEQIRRPSVLEELYLGNLCPMEDPVSGDSRYRELNRRVSDCLKKLEACLTEEQMALVNEFHGCLNALNCWETEAKFKYGFTLAALMMQEINTSSQIPER